MAPLDELFKSADHSWLQQLCADPETDKYAPNKTSRQVRSGHYVRVKPTPLPEPRLVIHSPSMAEALGISSNDCFSDEFAWFFSGQQDFAEGKLESWCTPYALAINGQPMVRQCPFGNGNGYGDGRAISIGEVVVSGRRWEMQLKGGGTTPFCRGADGRAVLRSSVREFLASEAMYALGVDTTRALSLVVSGGETADRPWYSPGSKQSDPDTMVKERCAITTRVAPSFLRIGHVDLFARRAVAPGATAEQKREHELMVEHALFREYHDCSAKAPELPERAAAMLEEAGRRIALLVTGWLRVGFCQGNFNSDNCLVGGRTMDYGPFGWVEKYDPMFAKWTGSGRHFAFQNQPQAGLINFETFADAVAPVLGPEAPARLRAIKAKAAEEMKTAVEKVWAAKLGFPEEEHGSAAAAQELWKQLERLMIQSGTDYTVMWRQLATVALLEEPEAGGSDRGYSATAGGQQSLQPGDLVELSGLKAAPELNGLRATCLSFAADTGRWGVALESGDKALKPENLLVLSSGQRLFDPLKGAFYSQLKPESVSQWIKWLRNWRAALASTEGGLAAAAGRMRSVNPKYIPREWMLVQAYDAAAKGRYTLVKELFELFSKPYAEQPEFEEKYFRITPPEFRGKGGCEVMT